MNDMTLIDHQIKTTNMVCDSLFGKLIPDVPQMIAEGQRNAKRLSRADNLDECSAFIADASLKECKLIIDDLIDRVATLVGLAPELEDAACALALEISSMEWRGEA
jgi:hypothetical protein